METLFEGEFSSRIRSKSLREIPSPFDLHPGAIAYLDRDKPIVVNEVMEGANKALSILGAMSAGNYRFMDYSGSREDASQPTNWPNFANKSFRITAKAPTRTNKRFVKVSFDPSTIKSSHFVTN